ncbi:MAG: hypothetical protein H6R25_1950 [Proteobacteria bacterium]|nr:hypothetical protein [Pseudomonadota bacterium]
MKKLIIALTLVSLSVRAELSATDKGLQYCEYLRSEEVGDQTVSDGETHKWAILDAKEDRFSVKVDGYNLDSPILVRDVRYSKPERPAFSASKGNFQFIRQDNMPLAAGEVVIYRPIYFIYEKSTKVSFMMRCLTPLEYELYNKLDKNK